MSTKSDSAGIRKSGGGGAPPPLDTLPLAMRDLDGRIRHWGGGLARLYGWSHEQAVGRLSHELLDTVFPLPPEALRSELMAQGYWQGELTRRRADGSRIVVQSRWLLHRDGDAFLVLETDQEAEPLTDGEIPPESHFRLGDGPEPADAGGTGEYDRRSRDRRSRLGAGTAYFDLGGHCLRVNPRLCAITGYSRKELEGFGYERLIHADDAENDQAQTKALLAGKIKNYAFETRYRRKDGTTILIRLTRTLACDAAGTPQYFVTVVEEFDPHNPLVQTLVPLLQGMRKKLADSREQSEARYRSLYQRTPAPMFSTDDQGRIVGVSDYWLEHMGYGTDEVVGRVICDFMTKVSAAKYRAIQPGLAVGGELRDAEFQFVKKSSEIIDVLVSSRVEQEEGGPLQTVSVLIDITARKEAERRLLRSEELRRLAVEGAELGTWLWDLFTGELFMSETCQELLYIPPEEPPSYDSFLKSIHPEDRARVASAIFRCWEQGGEFEGEFRVPTPDGGLRWLYTKGRGTQDADGRVHRLHGITTDITEHKLTEEALAHSQKLEAVGQITGGIAHDFNNYLCIILGNLEQIEQQMGNDPNLGRKVGVMIAAAERASHLTGKLLAFSRRQELRPEALDIGSVLLGIEDLLRQTIPPSIEFRVLLPEALEPALTDRNQLETAVLNLVLNARDAMPDGGKLSIEAADVAFGSDPGHRHTHPHPLLPPGNYVGVTVSDTGHGMSAAVQKRALEPFFTTKETGKGTGLGLSQVYGFLRQSGGHIEIRSTEGAGTQIRMLLPRP